MRWLVLFSCMLVPGMAHGQAIEPPAHETVRGAPLELEEVLASFRKHHPLVLADMENVRAARSEAAAARGEFDPVLGVSATARPAGYYDMRKLDVSLEQATPFWGSSLYTGYRITRGKVPDYYGEHDTLDMGEVRAGVRVPLLADRAIDARRAGIQSSEALARAEQHLFDENLLLLQQEAARVYYDWVAAGQRLIVMRNQVALARLRQAQIAEKVVLGALPAIEEVDNRRALLEREQRVVRERRAFEKASIYLSLFLRDAQGTPILVGEERLPLELGREVRLDTSLAEAEKRALDKRPVIDAYTEKRTSVQVQRSLADAQVQPRLDVSAEVSKDFGQYPSDPPYADTLEPTVVEAGVKFYMPLLLRKARGKLDAAAAKLRAIDQEATYARDKVRAEVRDSLSQLEAARERVDAAATAAELAERVAQGERERFELGATTVLFVNLREQAAADAQTTLVDALVEQHFALARAYSVMGMPLGG